MYDKYLIVGDEFKNVEENGKVTGFQIGERLPYYRGVVLSLIGDTDLAVDGEHFSPDDLTLILDGKTYKWKELEKEVDDRWEFGDVGIVRVAKPGGLKPGEHKVELRQHMKISYVPRGFVGNDSKVLNLAS
jgi:Domain of unknown function (DUF6379)